MTDIDDPTGYVHQAMPLCAMLGVTALTLTPAEIVLCIEWAPGLCTMGGVLHGGVVMALADSAGAAAAFINLPDGAVGTSTIESKTNFLGGVTGGAVVATARPLHVGAATIVVETEVTNDDRLVAKVIQTQLVIHPRAS